MDSAITAFDRAMIYSAIWMISMAPAMQAPAAVTDSGDLRDLIGEVGDFVYSFDDPGFYRLCEFVGSGGADALLGDGAAVAPLDEWKPMLERPSDYRGRVVVIAGVLQTSNEIRVLNRPRVERLFQYEISRPGTRAICTVICTDRSDSIRRLTPVKVRGIFFKARSYRTDGGEDGAGPLIVARSIEVPGPATGATSESSEYSRWLIGGTFALVLVWFILRRATHGGHRLRAASGSGSSGDSAATDADFDWMMEAGGDEKDSASRPSHHI